MNFCPSAANRRGDDERRAKTRNYHALHHAFDAEMSPEVIFHDVGHGEGFYKTRKNPRAKSPVHAFRVRAEATYTNQLHILG